MMEEKVKINPCGFSCDICDNNTTKVQDSAGYLLDAFRDPGLGEMISLLVEGFKTENLPMFKEMLKQISKAPACPGCDEMTECTILQCLKERGLNSCSECSHLDFRVGKCTAEPTEPKGPMMASASSFLNMLFDRYQGWNLENLKAIKEGRKEEVIAELEKMVKEGKTHRDLIDLP